jgi:hypothetical protein
LTDWELADRFVEWLSKTVRAALGIEINEDKFQGLIHTNDDRERSKLTTRNVYRHAYMDLLASEGKEEWALMGVWAEEERHLFIAEDGERATNFISAMHRKEQEATPATSITVQGNVPPTPEKQEKKGLFRR